MRRLTPFLVWFLVLSAAAAGVWYAFQPAPIPCDFAEIDRGSVLVTVDEDGRTRLKDRYIVSAPLSGRTERITLNPGDPVIAGQTVLTLITATAPSLLDERARAEAEARVRTAQAAVAKAGPELMRAEVEVEHLTEEYSRVLAASKAQSISRQELEDERVMLRMAEQTRDAARFALQVAEYELEQAQAALLQATDTGSGLQHSAPAYEVRSPIDGRVLRVFQEDAAVVGPGDALIELGSLDAMEVEVDVLSDQAVRVKPGARVSLERWGGDQPLAGVVRVVEPSGFMKISALGVEEQRVNVIIDFLDDPSRRATLGDNFRVEARIVVDHAENTLRVPLGALFRLKDEWAVFSVVDGRARLTPVSISRRSDRVAECTAGLDVGDRVILFPSDQISDGVRVTARTSNR